MPLQATAGGSYRGYQYWKQNQTLGSRTIVETPFARAQMHTVRLESGKVVNDWLWFDEGDAVNVLARAAPSHPGAEPKYIVFEQEKYGFAGKSFAPVGGFIEPHEAPLAAAQRELLEETGLTSAHWTELGAYRVGANRGAGVIHCFLALDATPQATGQLRGADLEVQRSVELTGAELLEALQLGKFKEIKWTATVALALLTNK